MNFELPQELGHLNGRLNIFHINPTDIEKENESNFFRYNYVYQKMY